MSDDVLGAVIVAAIVLAGVVIFAALIVTNGWDE